MIWIDQKKELLSINDGSLLIKNELVSNIDGLIVDVNDKFVRVTHEINSSTESYRIIEQAYKSFSAIWHFSSNVEISSLKMSYISSSISFCSFLSMNCFILGYK